MTERSSARHASYDPREQKDASRKGHDDADNKVNEADHGEKTSFESPSQRMLESISSLSRDDYQMMKQMYSGKYIYIRKGVEKIGVSDMLPTVPIFVITDGGRFLQDKLPDYIKEDLFKLRETGFDTRPIEDDAQSSVQDSFHGRLTVTISGQAFDNLRITFGDDISVLEGKTAYAISLLMFLIKEQREGSKILIEKDSRLRRINLSV